MKMKIFKDLFKNLNTKLIPLPNFKDAGLIPGEAQHAGALSVVPLLGNDLDNGIKFLPPFSGIKVSKVEGYGNIELANNAEEGLAIVPLHIGYIQQGAQNHALCRSGFLAAGQKVFFNDACCVQEAQGGYLKEKEQWFFILPLELRKTALHLRGKVGYNKLWESISKVNTLHGQKNRGHLDEIVVKLRNELNIFSNRFEAVENQRGALFFINGKYAGIEIAPSELYFREVFSPLLNFCYGPAALKIEQKMDKSKSIPFNVNSLTDLKIALKEKRKEKDLKLFESFSLATQKPIQLIPEEKFLNLELKTVEGNHLNGQVVVDDEKLIYASVFSTAYNLN